MAVVERIEVEFSSGLNVITGETGAGKSVLMGAVSLVLGARGDPSMVREGASEAEVEAVFDGISVRRTLTAHGKSRAWINDESVSIAELKDAVGKLVDIHGPRANQQLLDASFQLAALDSFGGVKRGEYDAAYSEYVDVLSRLEKLQAHGVDEDELDLLRYQVSEIEEAGITEADDDLAERHAAAAHAMDVLESANAITEGLGGDGGVADVLARLQPKFAAAARHFPAAKEWASSAEELIAGVQELSRTVAEAASKIEASEGELDELDKRLSLVNRLRRKYGDPMAKLAEKRARLDELEHREERIRELEGRLAELKVAVEGSGAKISAARHRAGERIGKRIAKELRELGFKDARFSVAIEPVKPNAHGCDSVTYMFGPNPGEPDRPLCDIASSGEVARVMLAVKETLAGHGGAGTLVFDEIDANVGGEIGAVVGAKLRGIAGAHQVIAITHLPQTAVFGERHLVVEKAVSEGRTRTTMHCVDGDARVCEVARMLGGENITTVVKRHAKELLGISR